MDRHDEEAELHSSLQAFAVNARAYSPLIPVSIYLPCLPCYATTPQSVLGGNRHADPIQAFPEKRIRRGGDRIWSARLRHLGGRHSRGQGRRPEAGPRLYHPAERRLKKPGAAPFLHV